MLIVDSDFLEKIFIRNNNNNNKRFYLLGAFLSTQGNLTTEKSVDQKEKMLGVR